ncbi:hypothetical protein ABTN47_18570, partial [Acinetobacter baumannii]
MDCAERHRREAAAGDLVGANVELPEQVARDRLPRRQTRRHQRRRLAHDGLEDRLQVLRDPGAVGDIAPDRLIDRQAAARHPGPSRLRLHGG